MYLYICIKQTMYVRTYTIISYLLCRHLIKATVVLLPLLGLTWLIGIISVNNETTVFAWIFTILNSLQVSYNLLPRSLQLETENKGTCDLYTKSIKGRTRKHWGHLVRQTHKLLRNLE